jgi:predicted GNAT family acetyltransferase
MVLLNDVVKVLALAESHAAGERAFRFQCFHSRRISRVFVYVDHPGHGIARRTQGLAEEALSR